MSPPAILVVRPLLIYLSTTTARFHSLLQAILTNTTSKMCKLNSSVLGLQNSSAKYVKKNTLLIALYGATAGTVAITHIEAVINQAVLAVVVKENHCTPDFIFFTLQQIKNTLIRKYRQGGQPNLSAQIIKSIKLRLPPLPRTKEIVQILNTTQYEIGLLKQIYEHYCTQKRGLMQKLLTGEWRTR